MLPDKCSIIQSKKQCNNPPEYVISILTNKEEYMVGLTCYHHKDLVKTKLNTKDKIKFTKINPVGTNCIRSEFIDIHKSSQ